MIEGQPSYLEPKPDKNVLLFKLAAANARLHELQSNDRIPNRDAQMRNKFNEIRQLEDQIRIIDDNSQGIAA